MPRRFDHIDLRVPSLQKARVFYLKLLPALGFKRDTNVRGWLQFESESGTGPTEFFGVTEFSGHVPNHNRIAFWASSVKEVDALARTLHEIGAKNIDGPAFEEPTYYAVFFEDPFGNRFEICHRTRSFSQDS